MVTNCLPPSNVRQVESPLGQVIPGQWAHGKSFYPGTGYSSIIQPPFQPPLPPNMNMSAFQVIPTNQAPNMLPPAAHSRSPAVHHQPQQQQQQQQQHQQQQQAISSSSRNSQTNENSTFNHSKHNANGSSNSPSKHHSKNSGKEGDHKRHKADESIHNWPNTSGSNGGVVRHSSVVIHETKNPQQLQSSVNHSSKSTALVSSVSDASQFPCAPFDSHNSGSTSSSSSSASASTSSSSTRQSSSLSSSSPSPLHTSAVSSVTLVQHLQSSHMETAQLNHHNSSNSNSGNLHHSVMYGLTNSSHRLHHVPPGHPAYRPQPLPGLSSIPMVNMPEPSGHCDTSGALPLTSKESTLTPRVLHCTSNNSDFKVTVTSSTTTKVTVTGTSKETTTSATTSTLVNENSSECLLPQPPSSISPTNSTTSSNSSSSGGAKFHKKAWVQKYQDTTTQDSSNINTNVAKVKTENDNSSSNSSSSASCNGSSSLNLTKNGYNSLHGDSKVNGKSSTISTATPSTLTATATTAATGGAANATCIVKSEKVDQLVNSKKQSTAAAAAAAASNDGHGDHKSDESSSTSPNSSKKTSAARGPANKSAGETVRSATNGNKKVKKSVKSDSDCEMKPSTAKSPSNSNSSKRKMTKEIDSDLTDEDVANSDSHASTATAAAATSTNVNKKRGPKYKKSSNAAAGDDESGNKASDKSTNNSSSSSNSKVSTSVKSSTKGSTKQTKKNKRSTSPDAPSSSSTSSSSSTYTTGEAFLQDKSCSELGTSKSGAKQISRCIECNMTPKQKAKKEVAPSVFCRFYQFRKLVYVSPKEPRAAGFSEPKDAEEKDVSLWMPPKCTVQSDSSSVNEEILKIDEAKFLIEFVGDHFCKLVEQEALAMSLHMGSAKIAWKSVVAGVREMCDVCATTLFNIHWFCSDCGFVVCIDCYRARKEIESGTTCISTTDGTSTTNCTTTTTTTTTCTSACSSLSSSSSSSSSSKCNFTNVQKSSSLPGHHHHIHSSTIADSLVPKATDGHEKDKDKFSWLLCNSKDAHSQVNLVLTQIIAKSALWDVCKLLHTIRRKHFDQECKCGLDEVIETLTYSSSPSSCSNSSSKASSLTIATSTEVTPSKDNLSDCNHEQVSSNNTNNNCTSNSHNKGTFNATANSNTLTTAATTVTLPPSTITPSCNNNSNSGSNVTSPLSILADVAINAEKRESSSDAVNSRKCTSSSSIDVVNSTGTSSSNTNTATTGTIEENENTYIFKRLRQLLQNPATAHAANGVKCNTLSSSSTSVNAATTSSVTSSNSNSSNSSAPSSVTGKKTKGKKIVLSSTQLNGVIKCDNNSGNGTCEESSLKYFKRQINPIFTSKNLPSRVCVTKETTKDFPHIEHDWFCSGKLLVLKDTGNEKNLELFQQQWIRHQVSSVNLVSFFLSFSTLLFHDVSNCFFFSFATLNVPSFHLSFLPSSPPLLLFFFFSSSSFILSFFSSSPSPPLL